MTAKVLITSFDVWQAHQASNAADDLLEALHCAKQFSLDNNIHLLRKLPVHFQWAPEQTIAKIAALKPDLIICCGMAEQRTVLTVERKGTHQAESLQTTVDVDRLVEALVITQISYDAGTFVCNHLYYSVLKYIQQQQLKSQCLFVHVPVLDERNRTPILNDFSILLEKLRSL